MHLMLRHRALGLATAVFLCTTALAAGLAFAGSTLDDRRFAVPILAVLIGTGVVALLGWASERARLEEAKAEYDERTAEHVVRQGQALAETERLGTELSAALATYNTEKQERDELESELRARVEGLERAQPETRDDYEARLDQQAEELPHVPPAARGRRRREAGRARVDVQPPRPDRRLRARPRAARRSRAAPSHHSSRGHDARRRRPRTPRFPHGRRLSGHRALR